MQWELFGDLPPEEVRRVLGMARRRTFGRGEVVFHEGDPADSLHLIANRTLPLVLGISIPIEAVTFWTERLAGIKMLSYGTQLCAFGALVAAVRIMASGKARTRHTERPARSSAERDRPELTAFSTPRARRNILFRPRSIFNNLRGHLCRQLLKLSRLAAVATDGLV